MELELSLTMINVKLTKQALYVKRALWLAHLKRDITDQERHDVLRVWIESETLFQNADAKSSRIHILKAQFQEEFGPRGLKLVRMLHLRIAELRDYLRRRKSELQNYILAKKRGYQIAHHVFKEDLKTPKRGQHKLSLLRPSCSETADSTITPHNYTSNKTIELENTQMSPMKPSQLHDNDFNKRQRYVLEYEIGVEEPIKTRKGIIVPAPATFKLYA